MPISRAPRRKMYRTMQGRMVDIEKLRGANENVQAVGNMRVNARGDVLGPGGTIIKPKEKVMKELEGAMGGMDEDNPDPRQMGQLMRKMCEMTGETMDEPMEEVVRKLEEGADPDELEDRMGDFLGDEQPNDKTGGNDEDSMDSVKSRLKKLMKKKMVRDPKLYEFSEYLKN